MTREKAQSSKESSFVWSDDEVELLLNITNEYKVEKLLNAIDWESVTSKYAEITNRFIEVVEDYRASSEDSSKDYRHFGEEITTEKVATKLTAARKKYRSAVDTGRESGHGRVILLCFQTCQEIWGGSATVKLGGGIETIDIGEESLSQTIPIPQDNCNATAVTNMNESGTQLANSGNGSDASDTESALMPAKKSRDTLVKRRALLDEDLKNHKRKMLEKQASPEAQCLMLAKEEMDMKKECLKYQRDLDAEHSHTMKSLADTMEKLSKSIVVGFATMNYFLQQSGTMMQ